MAKYGTFACPDCGVATEKTSPNKKRCTDCAKAAHGETGRGFKERACVMCGGQFKPTSSAQKACKPCTPEFRAQQNRANLARLREEKGKTPIGTIKVCPECGDDFEYRAGPQWRCPSCQRADEIKKIHEWLASDQERLAQYRARAIDNYNFGGNRKKALERDSHTCQHCGAADDLHVHHIDGQGLNTDRSIRNNDLDNLITLCRGCHTYVHHCERRGEPVMLKPQTSSS